MYVSGDDRAAEARRGPRAPPRARSCAGCAGRTRSPSSDGEAQGAAYAASSAAAEAIAGAERHARACSSSTTPSTIPPSPGRTCAATTDRVLRRTLGMSLAELDAAVAERLRLRGCPSCPRSRRSAATSRRTSRAGCCSGSRCSTRAGARPLAGEEVAAAVEGRRVEALERRGKYLIWELEDDVHLMLHLRMTGHAAARPARAAAPPAACASASTTGSELFFDDPRRFGTGELALGDDGARRVLRAAGSASSRSRPTSRARTCTRSRA